MRASAIGHEFDQSRAFTAASTFGSPTGRRVYGEIIIAIDTQPRDANAGAARRERTLLAAGIPLERRDRPLIVDHIENHRRPVHLGESQCVMEIGSRRTALTDPGRCNPRLSFEGGGHTPADGLRIL